MMFSILQTQTYHLEKSFTSVELKSSQIKLRIFTYFVTTDSLAGNLNKFQSIVRKLQ